MFPSQINFPEFVADQLLTSEHLNQVFGYLDEQGRLTRTNLIGIGIVCGLEVKAADTSITITGGSGVTSEGYLVSVQETTYTKYKSFNAVKERLYGKFVDNNKTQRFAIDELMQAAVEENTTDLDSGYLADKVVLLFVELLEEGAKNCNPNSCDDKGVNVTVTVRPLLISKSDAASLIGNFNNEDYFGSNIQYASLPDLKMRRFDVPAAGIANTADLFDAYREILTAAFLNDTEAKLSQFYDKFSSVLGDMYPVNPFAGLAGKYSFLNDDNIVELPQLVNMQYYYDLFSDLMEAYNELRKKGIYLLGLCCPPSDVFPRHLMLNTAVATPGEIKSHYRNYFIPSPALACNKGLVAEMRVLFRRLVLMLENFEIPALNNNGNGKDLNGNEDQKNILDTNIKVTPSRLGDVLSHKAIPFYYHVNEGTEALYTHWNFERRMCNTSDQILSYNSGDYNNQDDQVIRPLRYDLEPYNFFRVEGIVGKPFKDALFNVNYIRDKNRLPFDVVALSTDLASVQKYYRMILAAQDMTAIEDDVTTDIMPRAMFQDIEALYDTTVAGFLSSLCKEMEYFYDINGNRRYVIGIGEPIVPLLKKCDPDFRYEKNSIGDQFEGYWNSVSDQPYFNPNVVLNGFAGGNNLYWLLLYYIERLSEVMTTSITSFNLDQFSVRYNDMVFVAGKLKDQLQNVDGNLSSGAEDQIDHIDALLYAARLSQFAAIYNDYKLRWVYMAMLQKFGYFTKLNPGIQHKAGVTPGGTFIIVYHEQQVRSQVFLNNGGDFVRLGNDAADVAAPAETAAPQSVNAQIAVPELDYKKFSTILSRSQYENVKTVLEGNDDENSTTDLDGLIAKIPQGTVIADFYLPYMNNSLLPPVYYIVEEPRTIVKPTIKLDVKEFCGKEDKEYPITVTPLGGKVSGEGVTDDGKGGFTFNPSKIKFDDIWHRLIELDYDAGDERATIYVTVYKADVATITANPSYYNVAQYTFIGDANLYDTMEWDFGDNSDHMFDNQVGHTYAKGGKYTVKLTTKAGLCSETTTLLLDVQKATIFIDKTEFCQNEDKDYEVTFYPPGGELYGITANSEGKYIFNPLKTPDVSHINYGFTEFNRDSVYLTIYTSFVDHFRVNGVTGPELTRQFVLDYGAPTIPGDVSVQWDLGDGTKVSGISATHTYAKDGDYKVQLLIDNHGCHAVIADTVTVAKKGEKKCITGATVVKDFGDLGNVDTKNFAAFSKTNAYTGMATMFSKLPSLDVPGPLLAYIHKNTFDAQMVNWVGELNSNMTNKNLRLLSIASMRIIMNLSVYICCVDAADFPSSTQVTMSPLMNATLEPFVRTTMLNTITGFAQAELDMTNKMLADVKAEYDQLVAYNERAVRLSFYDYVEAYTKGLKAALNKYNANTK